MKYDNLQALVTQIQADVDLSKDIVAFFHQDEEFQKEKYQKIIKQFRLLSNNQLDNNNNDNKSTTQSKQEITDPTTTSAIETKTWLTFQI
jgi:uncharacterized membrane protein YdfJ with MMPL/SSD domain